jgi:hypothetical protein
VIFEAGNPHAELTDIAQRIKAATKRRNQFLKERGLGTLL